MIGSRAPVSCHLFQSYAPAHLFHQLPPYSTQSLTTNHTITPRHTQTHARTRTQADARAETQQKHNTWDLACLGRRALVATSHAPQGTRHKAQRHKADTSQEKTGKILVRTRQGNLHALESLCGIANIPKLAHYLQSRASK